MSSTAQFTAAMEAPIIKMEPTTGTVSVSLAIPLGASNVAVFLYEKRGTDEIKRMVEAGTGKLLEEGAMGRTMKCNPHYSQLHTNMTFHVLSFHVTSGLAPDTRYTATYSTRGTDDFGFGPESPRSLPKTFSAPQPPAMPVVHPQTETTARVYFAAPYGCTEIEIVFTNEAAGDDLHEVRSKVKLHIMESRSGCQDVSGLKCYEKYTVTIFGLNCAGTIASPSTTYYARAEENMPIAPPPPLVEVLGETSVRVSYIVPLRCTNPTFPTTSAMIYFESGGKELVVNSTYVNYAHSNLLLPIESATNYNFQARNASLVVTGLTADTTYAISVKTANLFGSSPPSPKTTVTTEKSEVEVTRVRSSEERDAELIKGAVDVDAENEAPNAKRAKQAPRNLEYVAIEAKTQMRKT